MIGFYCIFALEMARELTNKCIAVIAFLTLSIVTAAQESHDSLRWALPDTIAIPEITFDDISDNPLYFKLFMPLVLYGSAVSDAITPERDDMIDQDNLLPLEPLEEGNDHTLAKMIDEALVRIYLEHPELVRMTETELMDVPGIIPISEEIASGIRLKDSRAVGYAPSDKEPERVRSRLRYWKTFGNFQVSTRRVTTRTTGTRAVRATTRYWVRSIWRPITPRIIPLLTINWNSNWVTTIRHR